MVWMMEKLERLRAASVCLVTHKFNKIGSTFVATSSLGKKQKLIVRKTLDSLRIHESLLSEKWFCQIAIFLMYFIPGKQFPIVTCWFLEEKGRNSGSCEIIFVKLPFFAVYWIFQKSNWNYSICLKNNVIR